MADMFTFLTMVFNFSILSVFLQGWILVEIVGEVEKNSGRFSLLAHDPHGKLGLL
jgi:hypothetical protein